MIWRPYTQEGLCPPPIVIERAKGAFLYPRKGLPILDGVSSWWVITHGHNQPEIVEAITKQAERLDQVLFANFTHPAAEDLEAELLRVLHPSLNQIFLSDNGSTAVEVALKMAAQAHIQTGQPKRRKFVAFEKAYHGDTVGAMSVSGRGLFTAPFAELTFHVLRAKQPALSTAPIDGWVSDFARIMRENDGEVAAVILEPLLQGAGGMLPWPKDAVNKIFSIAKANGAFVIYDEVFTGFGRTGTMFAYEQLNSPPDFICLSKGLTGGSLPLGATITTKEIFDGFYAMDKTKMFFHGHSFTGNPLACAAAAASLRLCGAPSFLHGINTINEIHRTRLQQLCLSEQIIDPRATGPLAAFDIPASTSGYASQRSEDLTSQAMALGLFIRPMGNTVYLLPPYCTTANQLHQAWDSIERLLQV